MKHLCTIFAAVFSFSLFAAPMATVDWVKQYVAKLTSTKAPILPESPSARPASVSETFSSSMVAEDGSAWDVTMALKSSSDISLIVTGSTVPGVTNGTVYAWNAELSAFESSNAYMPVIKADTFGAARPVTNLAGSVSIVTNTLTHYTAQTADGVDFWSATYFATDYLVSAAGFSGPRLAYVVSSSPASSSSASTLARGGFSWIPSAMADDFSEPAAFAGGFYIGEVVITRKGGDESYTLDHTYYFHSGVGSGSIAEFTAEAFSEWYASPADGVFQEYAGRLIARLDDYQAGWGMGKPNDVIDLGNDQLEIRYGDLYYRCEAFKSMIGAAKQAVEAEFSRQFMLLYNKLNKHPCPSLAPGEEEWTIEMECKCRYTYPDIFTGEDIACLRADVSSHDFRRYKLVGGRLVLSDDGAGCLICSRCFEHRDGVDGVEHVEVPESAEYCGCYCGYYYEKKESDSSGESEGAETPIPPIYGGGEVIEKVPEKEKEDVEIECKGPDGDTVSVPVSVEVQSWHLVTNKVSGDKIPWRHVSRTVMGANGKLIKVTASAASLMDSVDGRLMHRKPQHPMECTCKCGVEHYFKPSPCEKLCRGCGQDKDCFEPAVTRDFAAASGYRADELYSMSAAGVFDDPAQIWKNAANTNWNEHLRANHSQFDMGNWTDEEKYLWVTWDGKTNECTWTNRDGGRDGEGNLVHVSAYSAWYYAIVTNGYAACGCACKRFFSDAAGNCGENKRDNQGREIAPGHHGGVGGNGGFHCYALRSVSEIACLFTRYYHETRSPETRLPACLCSNNEWERENEPTETVSGWVGAVNKSNGGSPLTGGSSLACPSVCMWCWPKAHAGADGALTLNYQHHSGINLFGTTVTGEVARVYREWIDGLGGVSCGCICQALTPETCLGDGNSVPEGDYHFDVRWRDVGSDRYHWVDFETDCVCDCGRYHVAMNPDTWEKYSGSEPSPVAFSACSQHGGVCEICGYYDKSGFLEDLTRADVESHVFQYGCECVCHSTASESYRSGGKIFRPDDDYDENVRGWSAVQDEGNYPNNTRSRQHVGYAHCSDAKKYHKSGMNGCRCSCEDSVGFVLYHAHEGGENCPDVCKSVFHDILCGHIPDYYGYDPADGSYKEAYGTHSRREDAAYCGCDCGRETTRKENGKDVGWHVAADGECYCHGTYAPGSPFEHGDAVLVGHVNLRYSGNIVTNHHPCPVSVCTEGYYTFAREFYCDNDHVVYGREYGEPCSCAGPGWTECPMNCACCNHHNNIACSCPYCLGLQTADECTCDGSSGAGDQKTLKFTQPVLGSQDVSAALGIVDLGSIRIIDGDDPVYEIDGNAFKNQFCDMPNLVEIRFNYVTNINISAFAGAFKNCPNLAKIGFARLEEISGGAFAEAFGDTPINLSLPSLWFGGNSAFENCNALRTISIPNCVGLGSGAFSGCTNLYDISANNLIGAGYEFLAGCSSLKKLSLPRFSDMAYRVFDGSSLTELKLPSVSTNDYDVVANDSAIPSGCKVTFRDGEVVIP